jgi:lysophospholipase L1-like esterase
VELAAAGLPAEVRNAAVEAQLITEALCNWGAEVQQWSPDVVILNYGEYECMPGILPRWLERHAIGWHKHPGRIRERYAANVVKPTWRKLARLQQIVDRIMDPGPFRVRPARATAELARFVDQVRIVGSPLILVMDTWPPSARWRDWFPGMHKRSDAMRAALVEQVRLIAEPDVRIFAVSEIVMARDLETALPDGVHFSADLHHEIASRLASVISEWAAQQPHLQHPGLTGQKRHATPE